MEVIAISATIASVTGNGCSRVSNSPDNVDNIACPLMGEMVTVSCATDTNYTILFGSTVVSNNQPVIVPSFGVDNDGTYECRGAGNQCGAPSDSLLLFSGGN